MPSVCNEASDSIGSAPLGQRRQASVARDLSAVKRMIRWQFRVHAAFPPHPQPGGDRSRRGRVRTGLQRPDRRDRRRQIDPRRGRRPAARRPRRPPISSARARHRPPSKPSSRHRDGRELIVRREISSQGRSRSFINGALATAAALRDLSARLVELHGQHEHQALLDPLTHLPLLDEYAGTRHARGRCRVRVDERAQRCASNSSAHGWTRARRPRGSI